MEPVGRPAVSRNIINTTVVTASNVTMSAGVGLPLPPTRCSTSTVASDTKATDLCYNGGGLRALQNCGNAGIVAHHHQYPPILVAPPPLVPSPLIHSAQTNPLVPTSQLMLPTTTTTLGSISQFQQHGGSHQLVTASTVPASGAIMPPSNISGVGMALSPFGILPHERVVPNHIHHRLQHKKLSYSLSSKTMLDTCSSTSSPHILNTPVVNPQRFYVEPTHLSNKMKQYESVQQQQNRGKIVNGDSEKIFPAVPNPYSPQSYDQRYQPRTTAHQVGYLSVITRTAVTTTNGTVMNDIVTNSNYYQTQPLPLQTKTTDNHDRHYYHFDSMVSASQPPQQQLDNNMLQMGTPIQRGDPMHIVKNLQSMQSDIDSYGISNKTVGPTPLLSNSNKSAIEHHHQHLQQLPKSAVIDSSSAYNSQYFNGRQPPPAHLHQHNQPHLQKHIIPGNPKILSTPTSLTVVSANGNTYLDVQQQQRHHRWNLDPHKPPIMSTSSCFPTNLFNQPSLQQQHQTYHNTVPTFNVQSTASSIHLNQQVPLPTHNNNFIVTSTNPTYYSPTTTIVSSTGTSVTTTSPPTSLYNRLQHNNRLIQHSINYQDLTNNNVPGANYILNDNNNSPSVPHVIVPNIELELSHLCGEIIPASEVKVKPLNVTARKPSFIDSYIKFIHRGTNNSVTKEEDECFNEKKLIHPLSSSTPKPISKPYIPLAPLTKSKAVSTSEQTSSRNVCSEDKKASNVSTTTTTAIDDDPRYFPLPKTSSSIAGISDDRSDGSHGENSCLSADDEQDQWWISSSKGPCNTSSTATSVIKNKVDVENKKKKSTGSLKKKRTNSENAIKKRKTQNDQPTRQLSHRLAKEKTKLLNSVNGKLGMDDDEDIQSDTGSDIDPAWKPNNDENDASKSSNLNSNRRNFNHKKYSKVVCSDSEHSPSISINNNIQTDDSTAAMPFKSGSFVALKSEFRNNGQVIPQQLWRVDGKSLLQKFQRCDDDNVYKSVSTYTGWSPSHYDMYRQVAVQFVTSYNGVNIIPNKSSNSEILVQLLCKPDNKKSTQNNSTVNTEKKSTAYSHTSKQKMNAFNSILSMDSTTSVDDQNVMLRAKFDVYIQTLVSQALDSEFLGEMYLENDQFFLSNVRAIESVTQTWVKAIDSATARDLGTGLSKTENIRTMITRFPNMEMSSIDESSLNNMQLQCIVCGSQGFVEKQKKIVEISLSGSEYNPRTLRNADDPRKFLKIIPMKKVHCCSSTQCIDKLIILHSLVHLKYNIYKECCKRITIENDNNCNDSTQDTTTVLNRLLADDEWIEKLFQMVCNTWSQAKKFVPNE